MLPFGRMQPSEAELTDEAVALMKRGAAPDAVLGHLVQRGADPARAGALVQRLVELKRQAEASSHAGRPAPIDAKRLSQEAAGMIAQGATPQAALSHLTAAGIAEVHARPEIERLYAAHRQRLASMRPCDRCATPVAPSDSYFDRLGNQVCDRCHAEDEIGASEQRAEDARLEAAGVSLLDIQKNNRVVWCPRCQDHSAVLEHATHLMSRGLTASTRTYRCTRCGQLV